MRYKLEANKQPMQISPLKSQNTEIPMIDSREVAEMINRPHNDLLKDIRRFIAFLGEGDFSQSSFFIESTYKNQQNKMQPCYLLTKMGCEMVANKMTGQKGVLFTAAYVQKFNEMEMNQQSAQQAFKTLPLSLTTSTVEQLTAEAHLFKRADALLELSADLLLKSQRVISSRNKSLSKQIAKKKSKVVALHSPLIITYQAGKDPLHAFFDQCCVIDLAAKERAVLLYRAFEIWMKSQNMLPFSQGVFNRQLVAYGFEKRRSSGNQLYFFGIARIHRE